MYKLALACLILTASAITTLAQSQPRIGVGLILGEPTGLSAKYWLSDAHAIDAAAAWSFDENDAFQLHGDYLWHRYEWLMPKNIRGTLPVYFGIGARLKLQDEGGPGDRHNQDENIFGIRVPLGVNYLPYNGPFDLFAELVPILNLAPDSDLAFSAALGARLYFP